MFSTKSKKTEYTITSSSWTSSGKGFAVTITVNGITENTNVEVLLSGSASAEQKQGWVSAMIVSGITKNKCYNVRCDWR